MSGEVLPALGDFPAGSRVASYQIEQVIGRGGMAVVYRATDVRLDRPVALKILGSELGRNDAFRERFIRESRAGAAVDHPHVIPVFEAGEADGVLFIAMRYVAGKDVKALIEREGSLSSSRTAEIVAQAASALDAAHQHGLIHRDVKPANMLVVATSDSRGGDHIYLSDFGLSKQSVSSGSLTGTGQFLGTLDYMSPEQIGGRKVDGRTDQYALACAAFEMLAGDPPFRREANLAVMWAQVSADPPSVRQRRPELGPAVDRVLARALAKMPDDRYANCTEFAVALRDALTPVGEGVAVGNLMPPVHPQTELVQAAYAETGPAPVVPSGYGANTPPDGYNPSGYGPSGPSPSGPSGYSPSGYGGYSPGGYGASGQGGYGYQPPEPPKRGKAVPILVGCLVVAALVAVGVLVLHLRGNGTPQANPSPHVTTRAHGSPTASPGTTSSSSPSAPPSTQAPPTTPVGVVKAYYSAINSHQYRQAWNLNLAAQKLSDFDGFKQGFVGTAHDTVTVNSVSGEDVSINLAAAQTDGTTKYYQGSLTVQNDVIVAASIEPLQ